MMNWLRRLWNRLRYWADPHDLRKQPFIVVETEMSIEEARARYPTLFTLEGRPMKTVGYKEIGGISVEIVEPLEVEVDPDASLRIR